MSNELRVSQHFGHIKSYKKDQQYSQRFWTIPSLYTESYLIFVLKCYHIPIIYIACKNSCYILTWGYQHMLVCMYQDSLGTEITKKESAIFTKIFWIMAIFQEQFSMPNCPEVFILHTTQIPYYLNSPNLYHYPPQFIYFWLSL